TNALVPTLRERARFDAPGHPRDPDQSGRRVGRNPRHGKRKTSRRSPQQRALLLHRSFDFFRVPRPQDPPRPTDPDAPDAPSKELSQLLAPGRRSGHLSLELSSSPSLRRNPHGLSRRKRGGLQAQRNLTFDGA